MSYFEDVGEFHAKFELAHVRADGLRGPLNPAPHLPPEDVMSFRVLFMDEELKEFVRALMRKDLPEAADALADLIYVALGTAHLMGIPFEKIWAEVQRANLTKVRAEGADDPRSKRGHALDVVKPAGFVAPDHTMALLRAGWQP